MHIRWMIRQDMPEVLAIAHASYTSPWLESDFVKVLRDRSNIGMVMDAGEPNKPGLVLAYMVYHLGKHRIDLLNMAVDPARRRRGIGRMMIDRLKGKMHPQRRSRLSASAWEFNLGGQLFLKAMDMSCYGSWCEDGDEWLEFEFRLGRSMLPATHNRIAEYFTRSQHGITKGRSAQ